MGYLDLLKGKALAKFGEWAAQQGPVGRLTADLVQNRELGSLSALSQTFQEKGLGEIMSSWVGTGANGPITAAQIQAVLGPDKVRLIAAKLGVPPELAGEELAKFLPAVVDLLTPDGKLPNEPKNPAPRG